MGVPWSGWPPVVETPGPTPIAGLNSDQRDFVSEALAGGVGATQDYPGPPAGFVRFYDTLNAVADLLAAPLINITHSFVPTAGPIQLLQPAASGGTVVTTGVPPLGAGEALRVTNGGAPAGRIQATYIDLPASTLTLIRMALTNAFQTIIPAPVSGYRALKLFGSISSIPLFQFGAFGTLRALNTDTIGHSVELGVNGVLVSRSGNAVAGNGFVFNSPANMGITSVSGPLQVRLAVAVVTNQPNLWACYESYT